VYLSPAKPPAGNRREAERAFAQAQQAQSANRLPEAARAYRQAAQSDPSYFEAHYNLGLVAFNSRNFHQSLAAWENALVLQPESVDARYNFALALKAANYPTDAAQELKQILAANANETRAHLVLGNLWAEQLGNATQARAHYLRVLELDPLHPQSTAIRYWLVAHPP
jgi:tetratricopeptide (TPR) repeat protein